MVSDDFHCRWEVGVTCYDDNQSKYTAAAAQETCDIFGFTAKLWDDQMPESYYNGQCMCNKYNLASKGAL